MKRIIVLASSLVLVVALFGCDDDNPVQPNDDPNYSISRNRVEWKMSSFPAQLDPDYFIRGSKILWHTLRDGIPARDIWDRETLPGEGIVSPFRIISRPDSVRQDSLIAIVVDSITMDTAIDTTFFMCVDADTTVGPGPDDTVIVCDSFAQTLDSELADSVAYYTYLRFEQFTHDSLVDVDSSASMSCNGITAYIGDQEFSYNNSTVLDLRVRGEHGVVHIDLGMISEDINGDGILQTEDVNANEFVEAEEDVGLDGLASVDEPGYDPLTNPDPRGDDWYLDGYGDCPLPQSQWSHCDDDTLYYEWLNNTEGNRADIATQGRPDMERFRSTFNVENSYISFRIDVADTSSRSSVYVRGSIWPKPDSIANPPNGFWKTFRISFESNLHELVNLPSPPTGQLKYMRIWFEHQMSGATIDTVWVADWRIVPESEL